MLTPTGNSGLTTPEKEVADQPGEETLDRGGLPPTGPARPAAERLNGKYTWAPAAVEPAPRDDRPVLALLCYEDPANGVGWFVGQLAGALARRNRAVHLFTRMGFDADPAGVSVHVLGDCGGDYLPGQVEEFKHRASNAFLQHFRTAPASVALMGFEWATIPALSLLHGIKRVETILSLHSLERQRSDLSSPASKRIDELEQTGLREAGTVLLHDSATGEVATACVPDCAGRVVYTRERFRAEDFATGIDPGAVKARYQVGPVDPTVLYVGDLDERYGPDLLVKAMPAVLRNHPQARLVVVGEGALYWRLRVFARYMLLEHAVRFPGDVRGQAMCELVQAADMIAVPSREATPWWPCQAGWAARRPVVATHNAAPTLLEHAKDSVLVYPSENSLVWGIERVLYDPKLAKTIGQNGAEKLEERFGWNVLAAQVEELTTSRQAQ
jgi:glycosyltransferase involved in cell wall biosynthesis